MISGINSNLQKLLKTKAAWKALEFVPKNSVLGIGSGSTVGIFIEILAGSEISIAGCVSSSQKTSDLLRHFKIPEYLLDEIESIPVYFDSADEIDPEFRMIKGGGGALTGEKEVSSFAEKFICIADESKFVEKLGKYPLPVEVIPFGLEKIRQRIKDLGGKCEIRPDFTTDDGNKILDITGLDFSEPKKLEKELNRIPGIITAGIFAFRPADILILGTSIGVEIKTRGVDV